MRETAEFKYAVGQHSVGACQIECYKIRGDFLGPGGTLQFFADAVGSDGRFEAGRSLQFKDAVQLDYSERPRKTKEALDSLIQQLTKDGWEPARKGAHWWQYRFRRLRRPGR